MLVCHDGREEELLCLDNQARNDLLYDNLLYKTGDVSILSISTFDA